MRLADDFGAIRARVAELADGNRAEAGRPPPVWDEAGKAERDALKRRVLWELAEHKDWLPAPAAWNNAEMVLAWERFMLQAREDGVSNHERWLALSGE